MLQTLGLPLPGDYGQVPAKLWYLHKVYCAKIVRQPENDSAI